MDKFESLISLFKEQEPFCLVRFNDGEMLGIDKVGSMVARGDQRVSQDLADSLKRALCHRGLNYWIGVPCEECWAEHRALADVFVPSDYPYKTLAVVLTNDNWLKSCEMLQHIGERDLWVVSGDDQNWENVANISRHETVPTKDAWTYRGTVMDLWQEAPKGTVVLISCGPLSRVLASEWWKNRTDCTVLDVGSTFDPFTRGVSHGCHEWNNDNNKARWCSVCNTKGK